MKLFSKKNENKDKPKDLFESKFSGNLQIDDNILNVLRREQNLPISDIDAEIAVSAYKGLLDSPRKPLKRSGGLSVAKTYGTKYVSDGIKRLASSDVVDVRSFQKEPQKTISSSKSFSFDDEDQNSKPSSLESGKDKSNSFDDDDFFNNLLKSIDDDKNDTDKDEKPIEENIDKDFDFLFTKDEFEKTSKKTTKDEIEKPTKKTTKKGKKKKKSVDIDIISGDFGGNIV